MQALDRRFWISSLVVFVVAMVVGFVNHGLLMAPDYAELTQVMRPEEEAMGLFHFQLIAHALIALGMTWIYRQGVAPGPWLGQGVRFGLAWTVAVVAPWFLIYHAVAQFPFTLTGKQILLDGLGTVFLGVILAYLNRR